MVCKLDLSKDHFLKITPSLTITNECTAFALFIPAYLLGWLRGPCRRWRWKLYSSHRKQFTPIWKRQVFAVWSTWTFLPVDGGIQDYLRAGTKGLRNDSAQSSLLCGHSVCLLWQVSRGISEWAISVFRSLYLLPLSSAMVHFLC